MELRIAGTVPESVVDGEGFRFTIFTQGCPHHCDKCHNPSTWDFHGGEVVDTEDIIEKLGKNPLLQGVTFSGGEPFMQPEPLTHIAKVAHEKGLDVWSWSGFRYEEIIADDKKRALLENVDILVDGRFEIANRHLGLMFRGSSNQRIIDVRKSLESGEVIIWDGVRDDV